MHLYELYRQSIIQCWAVHKRCHWASVASCGHHRVLLLKTHLCRKHPPNHVWVANRINNDRTDLLLNIIHLHGQHFKKQLKYSFVSCNCMPMHMHSSGVGNDGAIFAVCHHIHMPAINTFPASNCIANVICALHVSRMCSLKQHTAGCYIILCSYSQSQTLLANCCQLCGHCAEAVDH